MATPPNVIVVPAANAVPGPVSQGQLVAIAGVSGTWVSLQNQFPDAANLPFGQASPGSTDTVDGEANYGAPYGVQGSDDFWHFVAPQPLRVLGLLSPSGQTSFVLPSVEVGTMLQPTQLAATGGVPFYTWSGSPPLGLSISSTGAITGDMPIGTPIGTVSESVAGTLGIPLQVALPIGFSLEDIFVGPSSRTRRTRRRSQSPRRIRASPQSRQFLQRSICKVSR